MNRIILLLLLILSIKSTSGQGLNHQWLNNPDFSNNYIHGMIQCQLVSYSNMGDVFFCGRSQFGDVILGKVDSIGNIQWLKQIGNITNEIPRDFAVNSNGDVIIAMSVDSGAFSSSCETFIISFDQMGNHLFTKKFLSVGLANCYTPNNIINDNNNYIITIYDLNSDKLRILKVDAGGSLVKSLIFDASYEKIYKTVDNKYILFRNDGIIHQFDTALNYINSQAIQLGFSSYGMFTGVFQLQDGSFIFYGSHSYRASISKLNSLFIPVWSYEYFLPPNMNSVRLLSGSQIDNNRLIFLGGNEFGSSISKPVIIQTDTSGVVLRSTMLMETSSLTDYSVARTDIINNKFIFTYPFISGIQQYDIFNISSTDTALINLCNISDTNFFYNSLQWNGSTTIFPISNISVDSFIDEYMLINNLSIATFNCYDSIVNISNVDLILNKLIISPNPSVGDFNINYFLQSDKGGKLEIFDMTGRIVFQLGLPKWTSLQNISLPLHICDGLYNCVITSGEARASKKLVLIRN